MSRITNSDLQILNISPKTKVIMSIVCGGCNDFIVLSFFFENFNWFVT